MAKKKAAVPQTPKVSANARVPLTVLTFSEKAPIGLHHIYLKQKQLTSVSAIGRAVRNLLGERFYGQRADDTPLNHMTKLIVLSGHVTEFVPRNDTGGIIHYDNEYDDSQEEDGDD